MSCNNNPTVDHASYRIELRVNDVPLDTFPLRREHSPTNYDTITLSGHTIIELDKDDVVTFHLVPENTVPRLYYIAPAAARLTVKKEPWF